MTIILHRGQTNTVNFGQQATDLRQNGDTLIQFGAQAVLAPGTPNIDQDIATDVIILCHGSPGRINGMTGAAFYEALSDCIPHHPTAVYLMVCHSALESVPTGLNNAIRPRITQVLHESINQDDCNVYGFKAQYKRGAQGWSVGYRVNNQALNVQGCNYLHTNEGIHFCWLGHASDSRNQAYMAFNKATVTQAMSNAIGEHSGDRPQGFKHRYRTLFGVN